jgi:hypothetical protein
MSKHTYFARGILLGSSITALVIALILVVLG